MLNKENVSISEGNQLRNRRVNLEPINAAEIIIGGLAVVCSSCFPVKFVGSLLILDGIFRPSKKNIPVK